MLKKQSRTKTQRHKPKLKWWYIIPIVLFVTLAGYTIIFYSKASDRFYSKTVNNRGLQGGTSTTEVSKSEGSSRVVGDVPVSASYTAKEMAQAKKACVGLKLSDQSSGRFVIESGSSIAQFASIQQQALISTKNGRVGNYQFCVDIDSVMSTLAQTYGLKASVIQASGKILVMEIWLEGN